MGISRSNTHSAFYTLINTAWPFSHMFMLVVGVAVLRARVWHDWRRWTPFFCGRALPLAMSVGTFTGKEPSAISFGLATTLLFGTLGYAVRTSGE